MRGGLLIFFLVGSFAVADAKPLPNSYGYGRTAVSSGPVLDLRGLLPAAPDSGPLMAPAKTSPAARTETSNAASAGLAASCYSQDREGAQTAGGEIYSAAALSASHPDMPLSSLAMITDARSGKEVIVRVNDRPTAGATMEISPAVAEALGASGSCRTVVSVRRLGPAPLAAPGGKPYRQPSIASETATLVSLPQAPAAARELAGEPASKPVQGGFLVQIGAFSLSDNAEAAKARAAAAGPVSIEPAVVGGVALYRVRLGPWSSREEAEQARAAAEALGFAGAKLTTP